MQPSPCLEYLCNIAILHMEFKVHTIYCRICICVDNKNKNKHGLSTSLPDPQSPVFTSVCEISELCSMQTKFAVLVFQSL